MISLERFGEIYSAERGTMGKKDITLKNYLSDTRRYADLLVTSWIWKPTRHWAF